MAAKRQLQLDQIQWKRQAIEKLAKVFDDIGNTRAAKLGLRFVKVASEILCDGKHSGLYSEILTDGKCWSGLYGTKI